MKRTVIIIVALMALCACEHDIIRESEFNITLDQDNTFVAGDPVRFNFEGDVDNIIFYSGEENRQALDGQAIVVKNIQNHMSGYEYTWTKPGTYEVTFICTNASYQHDSQQREDFTLIIVE